MSMTFVDAFGTLPRYAAVSAQSSFRTRLRALGMAVGAALLAAGCAAPGPAHRPLALTAPAALGLPATDGANDALLPSQHWWVVLGDPQLAALVERALQGHPSLDVARARQARALALVEASRSAGEPHGNLGLDVTRQRYSANGLVPAPIAGNTWTSANLQASLE